MVFSDISSRAASAFTELNQEIFCTVGRGSPGTARRPHLTSSQHLPLVPHRAVRALCDHAAAAPDQLSFRRGEVLRVIATVDEDWLRCGRGGVEGLVPVGYTSLVL